MNPIRLNKLTWLSLLVALKLSLAQAEVSAPMALYRPLQALAGHQNPQFLTAQQVQNLTLSYLQRFGRPERPIRVVDLIRLRSHEVLLSSESRRRVERVLQRYSLRFGVTGPELDHYLSHGELPRTMSLTTYLENTGLPARTVRELRRYGVHRVTDVLELLQNEPRFLKGELRGLPPIAIGALIERLKGVLPDRSWVLQDAHAAVARGDRSVFVDELDLAQSTIQLLRWKGLCRVGDLLKISEPQLRRLAPYGFFDVGEIKRELKKMGFKIGQDLANPNCEAFLGGL